MKTQELNQNEQKKTNGGSLLGGDDNMFKGVSQGYADQQNTDDDGDTESNHLDFGTGSLLNQTND